MYNQKLDKVRAIDFKSLHPAAEPASFLENAFATRTKSFPTAIDASTPKPKHIAEARKYSDAADWGIAKNAELTQLDKQHAIDWLEPPLYTGPYKIIMFENNIQIPKRRRPECDRAL